MEAPNGHRALVKGFDGISADETITFCGQLPDGTYCNLCRNVFPFLHRDPDDHYFCESCTQMSTTDDVFECPEDGSLYSLDMQLTPNVAVSQKVRTQFLYCPQSPKDNPIKIPFSALKAHMNRCQCAMAAREQGKAVSGPRPNPVTLSPNKKVEDVGATKFTRLPLFDTPRHDRFGETAAMATAHGMEVPEKSAQMSHEEDATPPIVETKVVCPYCQEWFLKSEITSHIKQKTCTGRPQQPSLPSSTPVQPKFEEDSRSSPTVEMEYVDSDQRIVPHNDPRDMQVDSSPVDGRPKGTTKDRDDERIARLEEHVEYLSKQLQKVTSDLKKVHYMLNILAPDPTSVKKLYPNLRTDE